MNKDLRERAAKYLNDNVRNQVSITCSISEDDPDRQYFYCSFWMPTAVVFDGATDLFELYYRPAIYSLISEINKLGDLEAQELPTENPPRVGDMCYGVSGPIPVRFTSAFDATKGYRCNIEILLKGKEIDQAVV